MNAESFNQWRWRVSFFLAAFVGLGWGILLGWYQVRLNAYLSAWLTLGVTLPFAFWGSMLAGLAFNLMLPTWHKLARWLSAVFIVILGLPWGMGWAVLGDGIDPIQLIRSTGWTPWQLEWMIALVGVLGGIFPRWLLIGLRPLAGLFYGLVRGPLGTLRGLVHLVTGIPRQALSSVTRVAQPLTSQTALPPATNGSVPAAPRARHRLLRRKAKTRSAVAANNHNSARIVAHVEDRCPYCLDLIKPNDPRGVRVCEVCRTPHHADCWAVAGKCQVPHLNV